MRSDRLVEHFEKPTHLTPCFHTKVHFERDMRKVIMKVYGNEVGNSMQILSGV